MFDIKSLWTCGPADRCVCLFFHSKCLFVCLACGSCNSLFRIPSFHLSWADPLLLLCWSWTVFFLNVFPKFCLVCTFTCNSVCIHIFQAEPPKTWPLHLDIWPVYFIDLIFFKASGDIILIYTDLGRVKHFFSNINQSSSYCKVARRTKEGKWWKWVVCYNLGCLPNRTLIHFCLLTKILETRGSVWNNGCTDTRLTHNPESEKPYSEEDVIYIQNIIHYIS